MQMVSLQVAEAMGLAVAGVCAGALNAVAGGGSFISFPALLLCRVPPIHANATNAFATWPGLCSAFWGYRYRVRPHLSAILVLSALSLAGGTLGGLLVLATPPEVFRRVIPWLLLFGTGLFVFSALRSLGEKIEENIRQPRELLPQRILDGRSAAQFALSLYGGYFAGGAGVLQIAALSLFGIRDVQFTLGLKNLLGVLMSGASLITLMVGGQIAWPSAMALTTGTIAGGYVGGKVVQRVNPAAVRVAVVVLCVAVTAAFFWKEHA